MEDRRLPIDTENSSSGVVVAVVVLMTLVVMAVRAKILESLPTKKKKKP